MENIILDIYNENCLKIMKEFKDESIDLVITSPPYNLNIKYKGPYKDNKDSNEYLIFIKTVMMEVKRILKKNGQLFLNIGYTNKNPLIDMEIGILLKDVFVLQNRITWVKNISINKVSYGHYKPINSKRYTAPSNETIFHYTKTGKVNIERNKIGVPYMDKSNLKRFNIEKDCRDRGNTWFIPYKTIRSRKKDRKSHPATYPKKLVEMCIKFSGIDKNGIILDPFLGSGTTCNVSMEMGFKSIGIELSNEYYKDIIKELKQLYNNKSIETNNKLTFYSI